MSTNTIPEKTLNRMTLFAYSAQHHNLGQLKPDEALTSALGLLNTCSINEEQKEKIVAIITMPCSDNAQEATSRMKDHIFIVLSGGELPMATPETQGSNSTSAMQSNSIDGFLLHNADICTVVFCTIFKNIGLKTVASFACVSKYYNQCAIQFVQQIKPSALFFLNQIKEMGPAVHDHFEICPFVQTFNFDQILEQSPADVEPSRLCDFLDWVEIPSDNKNRFREMIKQFDGARDHPSELALKNHFSKLYSHFAQAKANMVPGSAQESNTKSQFAILVHNIVHDLSNCMYYIHRKAHEIILGTSIDFFDFSCNNQLALIKFQAGHVLCEYRNNLLKTICRVQNPNEYFLEALASLVMQHLAPLLGMNASIFNVSQQVCDLIENVDDKVQLAVKAFLAQYNPLDYLTSQMCICTTRLASHLRNNLFQWTIDQYAMRAEDPDHPKPTDLNPILSAHFAPDSFQDFENGGDCTLAAAFFILEAAGIIQLK